MKYFIAIIVFVVFSSCLRLDDNLYNLTDKITEYKLDNYTGEQDFILDNSYHIPDSMIHIFTLSSQTSNESTAKNIYAIYIGQISRIQTDTVIMYCHGNKWHMDFYWQRAKLLAHTSGKNKYGVLMIDYRGYGLSEGKPSEDGMYADVDAALQWLKLNGLSNSRLMMYGFSMGTAPTCELTNKPRNMTPSKIILEAPFASADVMANDGSGLNMPGSFFTNLKIDNAEVHWIREDLRLKNGESMDVLARIRYRQPLENAKIYQFEEGFFIEFENPQSAIAEGQFAAWYVGEELLGSGVIS